MCEAELASAGFDVTEEKFEYSQFPARWGPSIFGLLFAVTSWSAAHLAGRHQMPFAAFVTAAGGMLLLALLSRKLLVDGTSRLPWMRSQSGNLVATRRETNATPRIWLVAHIDSKSQTIPMLLRVAAVATSGILFTVMLASILAALALRTSAVSSTLGVRSESFLRAAQYEGLFAAVASIPVILCFIGNKSRGALDNASGVASVLLAAEMLSPGVNVGVLITSAEELGLAGARAFAATGREKGIAINCDTIDDSGVFICMTRGVMSPSTAQAVDSAARRVAIRMRRRGMIPGILADNVAFTDAGWESFTVSRGNPGTLARVHTSRDTAANMKGTGLATAARLMAATVEELS